MGFFIAIFARKNGLSEKIIFDWMLFLELTFKDNSDHYCFKQSSTSSKYLFFSKLGILYRSYGSLKQNLHSVVHQRSAVPLPVIEIRQKERSFNAGLLSLNNKMTDTGRYQLALPGNARVLSHLVSRKPGKKHYRVSHKKGIDKKLLFGAAQGFNLQFLNLFGFSTSVSFVWCII